MKVLILGRIFLKNLLALSQIWNLGKSGDEVKSVNAIFISLEITGEFVQFVDLPPFAMITSPDERILHLFIDTLRIIQGYGPSETEVRC